MKAILFMTEKSVNSMILKTVRQKGIVIIHQELALIPYMTIGENMFLGNERGKKAAINWDETYRLAEKYTKQVGLTDSVRTLYQRHWSRQAAAGRDCKGSG